MAQFNITIPDAAVPRIRLAFGRIDPQGQRIPATEAEVSAEVKAWMRGRVLEYEVAQAAAQDRQTRLQEQW